MYTATVLYEFKEDAFQEACEIWERDILDLAARQPGFVRMQLLTAPPRAMAMGTWEDPSCAQAFMQTGVFRDLLEKLAPLMTNEPRPEIWDLRCFRQA